MKNNGYKNILSVGICAFLFVCSQTAYASTTLFTVNRMPVDTTSYQATNSYISGVTTTENTNQSTSNTSEQNSGSVIPAPAKIITAHSQTSAQSKQNATNSKSTSTSHDTTTTEGGFFQSSGLTAFSLMGSDSFMPDTIVEWILTFFAILIIIIFARLFGRKQHYEMHLAHAMAEKKH